MAWHREPLTGFDLETVGRVSEDALADGAVR
ncbi:hypothetical protein BJY54_005127 [Streptomyces nodosus]|nr:hypothetical protein [Streptomyces nodosus]